MPFWEIVHPDMREIVKERGLARQSDQHLPARYELKALTKDGQTKWIDMAATTFKFDNQSATLATAYDITERKLAEKELLTREAMAVRESSLPIRDYKGAGETILVVDDVATQREIACSMLSVLGYKTTAVSSGEEAVKYLQTHNVDLILLDMIMDPGINGRETYERAIKIHPNQKAVITSGFAETDEVREAQRLGAGPFIKKPLTLEKLGFAIKDELK
jgi:CheY-like chemotaxis protein